MDRAGCEDGDDAPATHPAPQAHGDPRRRRWAVRCGLVLAAALCSALAWAGAAWPIDLAANLTAQWGAVLVPLLVIALTRRRWACAAGLAACIAIAAAGLAAAPRAATSSPADPAEAVRVVVVNAASSNVRGRDLADQLAGQSADILVLLETPEALLDVLRAGHPLTRDLPAGWIPDRATRGFTVVLSRWPQRGGDGWEGHAPDTFAGGVRAMRIDRPGGPFMLLVLHPDSPRTQSRWAQGNDLVRHGADVIRDRMRPEGIPIIAAGDLNSTPTGHRSRLFSRLTGLRRAKPLAAATGTWPSWSFWPLRAAIDDVFVDPGVGVVEWRTAPLAGSDHSAVVADLAVPAR